MKSVNRITLVGSLGMDPEVRYAQSGASVCNFRMATNETWDDKASGERKERTEWHRIVAFGNLAESCGKFLRKGSLVYVEGKATSRQYEKDGEKRYINEVHARDVVFLDKVPGEGDGARAPTTSNRAPSPTSRQQTLPVGGDDFDDDIPF
jgi:single-strand DNA-binding protein